MKKVLRNPSIHVSQSDFKKALQEGINTIGAKNIDSLVNYLVVRCSKYSLTNRKLLATTQKQQKTTQRLISSNLEDAKLFSQTLLMVRRQFHHRGVVAIKEDSRDWLIIKEITELALGFSEDFGLDRKEGFKYYIAIALRKMRMFSINKFKSLHESICLEYEALEKIKKDPYPQKTREASDYYSLCISQKVGDTVDYSKIPDKYQYFMEIAKEAMNNGVSIKVYIDAQFSAFDWKSAVPEISQMVGPKAKERLVKYMYANDIKKSGKAKPTVDFSKIKS